MTKRKNVVSKMLLLVLILTLISCCFLGSTFARYTSSGNGSGTLNVAKWAFIIKGGAIEVKRVNFEKSFLLLSTIITYVMRYSIVRQFYGKIAYCYNHNTAMWRHWLLCSGRSKCHGNGVGCSNPTEAEVKEVFSIKLLWYTNDAEKATNAIASGSTEITLDATNGYIYIYAEVTWTSDTEDITGTDADEARYLDRRKCYVCVIQHFLYGCPEYQLPRHNSNLA